jgi:hypothetical protein
MPGKAAEIQVTERRSERRVPARPNLRWSRLVQLSQSFPFDFFTWLVLQRTLTMRFLNSRRFA